MDWLPFWAVAPFTIVVGLLSLELGFRLGRKREKKQSESVGTMVQAALAMLAFLVAFVFNVASERFNDRRNLVVEEANAIGTTYLRAGFFPDEGRDRVRELLRQYLSLRVTGPANRDGYKQKRVEAERLQEMLWKEAESFGKNDLNSDIGALFAESLNEMIDLQSKRIAASVYWRIPDSVWYTLYVMISVGIVAIGCQAGQAGERNWTVASALLLSFAVVLTMIVDLDRPRDGFLNTNLQPLQDLTRKFESLNK